MSTRINTINTLLAGMNPSALHGNNGQYKILDIMTVSDIESTLHEVTHMALMNLVVDVNKALAN